jgi:hypothetical protein
LRNKTRHFEEDQPNYDVTGESKGASMMAWMRGALVSQRLLLPEDVSFYVNAAQAAAIP